MSDDDALGADMHPLLGFLESAPSVADQDMLERLLEGRLDPASAPPGYGGLARLLAAATAPATSEELAVAIKSSGAAGGTAMVSDRVPPLAWNKNT